MLLKLIEAGSGIINVTAPGHGLTNGDTKRFRGPPLAITASGGSFQFGTNPESFDGISGSNIAKAAGYTITTGLYVNDARVSTDYAVANFSSLQLIQILLLASGGGNGCSVGPVTLSA